MNRSNKIEVSIVGMAILLLASGSISLARYSGGNGMPESPYRISTAEDLNNIGNYSSDWNKHFVLVNDINMAGVTGSNFNMIGYYISYYDRDPFDGVFDGNDHTIMNFTYIATTEKKVGIFVYVDGGGKVMNVGLVDPNVQSSATQYCNTGPLVSYMRGGTVTNCCVKGGSVSGYSSVGGLIGYMYGGQATGCRAESVEVRGEYQIGGLAGGTNIYATISECCADCDTQGGWEMIGGCIGKNDGWVRNSYARGYVAGPSRVGGFIGRTYESNTIANCYSVSEVNCTGGTSSSSSDCGGFIGSSGPTVGCFWDVEVSNQSTSGGGTGMTTLEMQKQSTFTDSGWDFVEVWGIGEGQTYPYLRKYSAGDLNHDGIVDWRDFAIFALHWLEGSAL